MAVNIMGTKIEVMIIVSVPMVAPWAIVATAYDPGLQLSIALQSLKNSHFHLEL
jgi:hypothetical protein